MFDFACIRARRRPGLTPLIDVVFLLLVFFMLAAQFGRDVALPLAGAAEGAGDYTGPPRLVTITPEAVLLNGLALPEARLPEALESLMQSAEDMIVLQPGADTDVQRLTDIVTLLTRAGFTALVLAEAAP